MLIETSRLLSRMFINKESVVHPTREPVRCAGIAICHDVKWATASFQNRGSLFLREMILTTRLRSWRV
jgi:hypothetical protein